MTFSHSAQLLKVVKTIGILTLVYFVADVAYIAKSAEGIDLLSDKYGGHHGWMFLGSDWAVHKIEASRRN